MKNKKILIIGGAGFIGHNLAIYLKKKKFDVLTVDNLKINNLAHVKKNIMSKMKGTSFTINMLNDASFKER